MNILIAGIGKIGSVLAEQLAAEGHDLILIDTRREVLEGALGRYDAMGVQGNCASIDTLRRASVERADLLIAATGTDEINLLCCMSARGLCPNLRTVCRVRDPEYIEQCRQMPEVFGLSMTIHPEKLASDEIARLIRYPGFLKRETFAHGHGELVELKLDDDSPLCGKALKDLPPFVRTRVLVCAVLRDGETVIPSGTFTLAEGDRIFVTAPRENLSVMLRSLGIVPHRARRVMIIGGSPITYFLAEELADAGIGVKIVEKDVKVCHELAAALPHADIICADVSKKTVLEEEGIAACDALVTLTGMDELNMVISLYGDFYHVPQVITKLGKVDDAQILDTLPLGSVISPRKLCCNSVVRFARAIENQTGAAITVHTIAGGGAEAAEFLVEADTKNVSVPLKDVKLKNNILIASITHGGKSEIPSGTSVFVPGDSVVVVCSSDAPVLSLSDIFE